MIFIGRKNIKLFKLFLVSPILEKTLMILFIIFLPLIAFYPEDFSNYTNYDLSVSITNTFNETYFSSMSSKNDFYFWVRNYVIPNYYTSEITPNMPIRSIRLRQYRYPCQLSDFSSHCFQMLKNLNEGNDPYFPLNFGANTCIFHSCEEFQYRYDEYNNDEVQGQFGLYPMFGYRAEIGLDESTALSNLNKLEINNWIDNRTIALLLEANYFNYWKEKYVVFRGLLEFQGERVIKNTFNFYTFTYYYDQNMILFIFLIFVIQAFLYIFKIMFEMTMICNRILALGQMAFIASQFTFIVLFSIEITYLNKASPEAQALSPSLFIDMYYIAQIDNYCKFMLFTIFIFYPFKVFQLISWSKYLSFLVKFWVTIYRTLPGIFLYFVIIMLITLSWSLGYLVIFQDYLPQFRNYGSSILSLFTVDFGSLDTLDYNLLTGTYNDLFFFLYFYQGLIYVLICVYFFAVLSDLFNRSATLEYNQPSPNDKETHEKLEEMEFKFDRFIKELRKEFNKDKKDSDDNNLFSHNQNKILIWLDCSKGLFTVYEEVMLELRDSEVQCRRFIHKEEVIQFLDYLFKLKPNLLSFRAGERFRIVAENYTNFNNQGDWRSVELLIDWLKHVGCRVPILIYSDVKLERDVLIYLKKKYPSILFVYEKVHLIRYCSMNDSIFAFYEGLNKQDNKERIDEGDSFTDEESFFE